MKKLAFIFPALLLVGSLGFALAQVTAQPKVVAAQLGDMFNDVVGGVPTAQNQYASAAQISAVQAYKDLTSAVDGTGDPGYTFTNGVVNAFAHSSGTISTATLTTEPNPVDGKRECWWSDHTTTTLTWTANNSAQTIGSNVHAAGIAYTSNCITYEASSATWNSSN